jgi:septum formation protein
MQQIILASTSPRRKQLLKEAGLKFKAIDTGYVEKTYKHMSPEKLVEFLALGKAKAGAKKYPKAIIVAADTIVVYKGKVFGKPHTPKKAKEMLRELSGSAHNIFTGLAVLDAKSKKVFSHIEKVKVYFKNLSGKTIDWYVATGEPLDKAGAYAVHQLGGKLVKKKVGDRTAAIGLPVRKLKKILKSLNNSFV